VDRRLAWTGAGFKILVRDEDATLAQDVLTPIAEGDAIPEAGVQDDDERGPCWRRFT